MSANEYPQVKAEKKPYDKPQVVYKEPLEAMAASCTPNGKVAGDPSTACQTNPFS